MKVQLFIPCFIDQLYPQTAFNMVKVLEKATCDVQYNTNQTCCGQPAFNAGFWDDSKEVGTKFSLVKVDGGNDMDVMKEMHVEALPTFIIYKNGKEVWRKQGIVSLEEFKAKL